MGLEVVGIVVSVQVYFGEAPGFEVQFFFHFWMLSDNSNNDFFETSF